METIAFCEIESYPRKVLAKHWPNIPIYEDVRNVTKERLEADGIRPDVICGGFPCQDISVASKITEGYARGAGIDGERSGLWSECARILGEFQPKYAIFENVTNLLNGEGGDWFKRVLWDISQVGYDAEWHCIPASHVGLPHIRDRIWIIAYPSKKGLPRLLEPNAISTQIGSDQAQPFNSVNRYNNLGVSCVPENIRVDDGLPNRSHRARALGNAVVPQIPELIGRAILEAAKK
jgi:DNA (cytosine-5)-methyltransferase 1